MITRENLWLTTTSDILKNRISREIFVSEVRSQLENITRFDLAKNESRLLYWQLHRGSLSSPYNSSL